MGSRSSLTGPEVVATAAVAIPASIIVAAYLLDRIGVRFLPLAMLPVAAGVGAMAFALARPRATWPVPDMAAWASTVGGTFGWLMWIARPSFLPLGSGPDLTHHLLLIQYIERRWRLVHEGNAEAFLGEMVQYTPGSHILTSLVGAWTGAGGLHVLHLVLAATVALKVGFVLLIALRVARRLYAGLPSLGIPFALLAVVLLFVGQVYLLRSFTEKAFVAQVVSELFAVAMWWALVVWDEDQRPATLALFGLCGAAAFLTWPVWIGPPVALFTALSAAVFVRQARPGRAVPHLAKTLALGISPIAVVVVLYVAGRRAWFQIAGTGGAAPWPAVASYGRLFIVLSVAGLLVTVRRREGRVTALLVAAIGVQTAALYLLARRSGAEAPYLALKMFYLLLYPQAVLAAVAVAALWSGWESLANVWRLRSILSGARSAILLWAVVAYVGIRAAEPLAGAPQSLTLRRHPAVSAPLEQAGAWARDHLPVGCVEYLVDDDETAYWLHLAVLGNPRMSARTGDDATFDSRSAVIRWLTPGGLPYAIADLSSLSRDVGDDLDVVARFGPAVVAKRRGESSCAPR